MVKFRGLTDKMNHKEAAKIAMAVGFNKTASWIRKNLQFYQSLVIEGYIKLNAL